MSIINFSLPIYFKKGVPELDIPNLIGSSTGERLRILVKTLLKQCLFLNTARIILKSHQTQTLNFKNVSKLEKETSRTGNFFALERL